jgi:hypothetical protein
MKFKARRCGASGKEKAPVMSDYYPVWWQKRFPDGRIAEVVDLLMGRARINLFRDWISVDDGW